jgi:hypothetical protein
MKRFIHFSGGSNMVGASFDVTKITADRKKTLRVGDCIKESWLEGATFFLFYGIAENGKAIQSIKDLPVRRNTVEDRTLKMKANIADRLKKKDTRKY